MKETQTFLASHLDFGSQTLAPPSLKKIPSKTEIITPTAPAILHRSVSSILRDGVSKHDIEEQDPFYVADLSEVVRQYKKWQQLLPRVQPFYAVKCNPDPMVLKVLAKCGTGFDCASKGEVQLVLDQGVDPSRIIYANPCKQASHIKFATSKQVNVMTFDNVDELYKIQSIAPKSDLVLRILTDDSKSVCRFGVKFGAKMTLVPILLQTAKKLNLNVIGISFHVGSGCFDASSFTDAVELARQAFDIGAALGFNFSLLDIGGGFPGNSPDGLQFVDVAKALGPAIDRLFPPHIRVISEPGRYFVSSAYTLAVNIVARRTVPRDTTMEAYSAFYDNRNQLDTPMENVSSDEHPSFMYYINDGMYGSFNCITFDHIVIKAKPLYRGGKFCYEQPLALPEYACSIWGPTCDSIDLISRDVTLPEMRIGDWLVVDRMGAYTMSAASCFNGFKKSSIIYTMPM